MPKDIDKQLDDILDISQDIKKKSTEVVKVPERTEHAETDYRYARENLYNLVERGQDAIDGILDLSKETESPRAYEVAGQLIKTVSDTAEKLIDIQKKLKDLEKENGFIEAPKFSGSPISFFNLGKKNNWKNLLETRISKIIEKEFEKEMEELNYI